MVLQGIRTNIAKKPYIFVIFERGSRPPVPHSGSADGVGNNVREIIKCNAISVSYDENKHYSSSCNNCICESSLGTPIMMYKLILNTNQNNINTGVLFFVKFDRSLIY